MQFLTRLSLYYHFAVLLLFRPFIRLRIIGSQLLLKDICSQAADAIQRLARSYSKLYTLRRTPSFIPYFMFASVTTQLAVGASSMQIDPEITIADRRVCEAVTYGIVHLTDTAPYHYFAKQALYIVYNLAQRWNLVLDIEGNKLSTSRLLSTSCLLSTSYL